MKTCAFVFPGQGSQSVGMLDVWRDHPVVVNTLAEASDALGENVAQLIAQGPKEELDLTVNTQPVMLVAGVAHWRVWMAETGVEPAYLAGHSLGEYTALVAAGVLSLQDALPLVRFRAHAMQAAVAKGEGAMAAILGLSADQVKAICLQVTAQIGEAGQVVEAVNFNDPMQTVIAGSKVALELACGEMKKAGAKRALMLPVSAPFHSSLMKPAAEQLKVKLAEVTMRNPRIPVFNNVDVAVTDIPTEIRNALYRQAFNPVRWVETIIAFKERGVTHVVECGPGKVLSGMLKRIDPDLITASVVDAASMQSTFEILS